MWATMRRRPSTVSRRQASEAQLGAGLPPEWTKGTGVPSPGSMSTMSSGCWSLHHFGACRYRRGKNQASGFASSSINTRWSNCV